jgi:RNA polymerase sigma factor (sigma-70 family)
MALNRSTEQLFAEVRGSCGKLIEHVALGCEADPSLRRELVQDILLAIWTALPGFRGESSVSTFALAIARKRCTSHASRLARAPRAVELTADLICPAVPPDEAALRNDRDRLLARSLGLLPICQREAILLCLKGFSYGEMATILGISTNAAMLRCQRAKGILQAEVERCG